MRNILSFYTFFMVLFCMNAAENVIFETDFTNESALKTLQKTGARVKIANGVLEINELAGGLSQAVFPVSIAAPCRISFKVRELSPSPKACHWGMILEGGENVAAQFYSRGKGMEVLRKKNNKMLGVKGLSNLPVLEKNPNAKWTTVRMTVLPGRIDVDMGKQNLGSENSALLPIRKIAFYAYNNHVQFDDFKIENIVVAEKKTSAPEVVFHASFDHSAVAEGANGQKIQPKKAVSLEYTNGISGKAVSLFKRKATKTPLKMDASWTAENGRLINRSINGMPQVKLDVPGLKDLTMSFRFSRTQVNPKDQHFGIFIHGENKNDIRLFTRGKIWTFIENVNGKQVTFRDFFQPQYAIPDPSEKAPFTELKITLKDNVLTAWINGKELSLGKVAVAPAKQVAIYAYGVAASIDDFSVSGDHFKLEENFDQFVSAGGNGELIYGEKNLFAQSGGLMFWVRLNRDALLDKTTYPLFRSFGTDNKAKINFFLWEWLRCDIGRKENMNPIALNRFGRPTWFQGDWRHLALTWEADGKILLYLDGLPYLPTNNWIGNGKPVPDADIESATRFVMDYSANASFDELKIYQGSVPKTEVWKEYRKYMPVDLVMQRSILDSSRNDEVAVQIAPGGFYMRPMPVKAPFVTADVLLKMDVLNANGTILKSGEKKFHVDRPQEFRLPVGKLASESDYRVRCTVKSKDGTFQRTFRLRSASPEQPALATKEDVKQGKRFFSKKLRSSDDKSLVFAGKLTSGKNYLEAGINKGNRFAFEIPFPAENVRSGKPVLLEIIWPDDKPRMMGLYLYKKTTSEQHRDRLQGGIQSGNEYPLSGKNVKTHYLFYPGTEEYLFEARTMANNFPAAVCEVNVYALNGDLPNLALTLPEGLPGRSFGMMDEDQTIETNLDYDNPAVTSNRMRSVLLTDLMLKYYDYTGQNQFHSPMLRYGWVNYQVEGNSGSGMYPGGPGELPYMVEAFGKRGKQIVGILNLTNLPEAAQSAIVDSAFDQEGMFIRDKDGELVSSFATGKKSANIAHPEVRKLYCAHVEELLKLFAKSPNFDGFELWMDSFGRWKNRNVSYDDWTIGQFEKETGIKVPQKGRFEFLTGIKSREWSDWRARKVTEFITALRNIMNRYNPNLKLYLAIGETRLDGTGNDGDSKDAFRMNTGIDFNALKSIPGVYTSPMRYNTAYRWAFHWGKPETDIDEVLYDKNKEHFFQNGAVEMSVIYPSYFETFEKSLKNHKFAGYFQNADVKPHGRFFLKELLYNVAVLDAQNIGIGAQPLGTWGRDAEAREFAQAYRALPKRPFQTVPGSPDPVAVRFLNTKNGTWFYLASMLFTDSRVTLRFSSPVEYKDLSTGKSGKDTTFTLLPFQLRSFLIPGKQVKILSFSVDVPEKTKKFYREKIASLEGFVKQLDSKNISVSEEKNVLKQLDNAWKKGEYAEVHRLCFSRMMNQLGGKIKNLESVLRQETMIRKGHFAVNCGDSSYYSAPNGQFFFPDRQYSDAAKYGHFGKYNSVGRSIDQLKEEKVPMLYRSEAYDIDGYKFKVPNGEYRVRLYMKIGWPADFKDGRVLLTVLAQGIPLFKEKDMFRASNGDFWQPAVFEFNKITVKDGMLVLRFDTKKGLPSNFRLCNGIEIIKEK